VAAVPGVERAALARLVPLDGSNSQIAFRIAGEGSTNSISPDINIVGAGYFGLLDIPVTQGREFAAADRAGSAGVAVVNEAMARGYWNGDAVGRTLTDEKTGDPLQIVGVVRDVRHRSFNEEPVPMVYLCAAQRQHPRMTLHVRTAVPPAAIGPAIHRALHEVERTAGLAPVETMTEYIERATLPQRLGAFGAGAVAVLELALVVMALYGVMAFAVTRRRAEIGLRMALGATDRSVLTLIMRDGLLLTAIGAAVGVGIALLGATALGSLLIGVGPADPASFGAAVLAILLVGAAASYVPARRALRVDPSAALRSE
jgi:predicted permease